MKPYDAIIIGSGQAGIPLAAALAKKGWKIAIAEGHIIGGSCVNYGCTPSKTLIASARAAHLARRGADYGVRVGDISIDFEKVMARVHERVKKSHDGNLKRLHQYPDHLDIYHAYAHFEDSKDGVHRVRAGSDVLEARRVYINVGARALIPNIDGLESVPYLDNERVFKLTALPDHVIALGGGYISLELGQAFAHLGSAVTVIESHKHIVGREDDDVIEAVTHVLKQSGLHIKTEQQVIRVEQTSGAQISVTLQGADGAQSSVTGSHLLVAVGRVPNSDRLNLEAVGVTTDSKGYIPVDDHLKTNIDGIYALGDVNGRGAFTHTAYQDYEIALDNIDGGTRSIKDRIMTYAMFIDPPLGRVGMNEKQARASGKNVLQAVYPMKWVSRAKEQAETAGLIKLLVDADTERFLGATVYGFQGDDVTQIIGYFMHTGASYKVMQHALPIHPTIGEFLPTILAELKPLT
jgi:pyruvate/2-oxoglutarate dehydrogenase complex dihydrolipoamide dehydrogenase (E3) component